MTDKYQSEEIIFITVAVNYLLAQGKMERLYDDTCIYMNWHMGLRVFIIQLKSIAKKYYGVKRIPREVDADIRTYLREWWCGGGYSQDVFRYLRPLRKKSVIGLRLVDTCKFLVELLKTALKRIIFYKEFRHAEK